MKLRSELKEIVTYLGKANNFFVGLLLINL